MRLPKVYKDIFILFYGDLLAIPRRGDNKSNCTALRSLPERDHQIKVNLHVIQGETCAV